MKQQSMGRHVAPLGHIIILISSQPVFVLTPQRCVLSGEAANIKFGLTRPGLESTMLSTTIRVHKLTITPLK